jgi:hypothetical protein
MNIQLPKQFDASAMSGTYNVKLHSDGSEFPLIRIDNPTDTSSTMYVYEDSGEKTVSPADSMLVKIS